MQERDIALDLNDRSVHCDTAHLTGLRLTGGRGSSVPPSLLAGPSTACTPAAARASHRMTLSAQTVVGPRGAVGHERAGEAGRGESPCSLPRFVLAVGKPSRDDARPFHGRDSEDLSGELVGLDEVVAEGPNVGGATAIGLSLPSVASQDGDVPAVVDGIGALTGPRAGQCRAPSCGFTPRSMSTPTD
jgi:hypothetical protein